MAVWSYSVSTIRNGLLDHENMGLAVDIAFLTSLEAELDVLQVWWPLS